jgi:hypothetical protein
VRGLVGRDFSAFEQRPGPRKLIPVAIALLLAGFGLAALRTEVLRLRYELAEGVERESKLQIERKDLTVEMRALRHPVALGERALEMGFVRADRIVDVPAHPVQSRADAAAPQQLSDLGSLAAADVSVAEPGVRP